jgi:hypothetical protein
MTCPLSRYSSSYFSPSMFLMPSIFGPFLTHDICMVFPSLHMLYVIASLTTEFTLSFSLFQYWEFAPKGLKFKCLFFFCIYCTMSKPKRRILPLSLLVVLCFRICTAGYCFIEAPDNYYMYK